MVKIWYNIWGKKTRLLGQGKTLRDAVIDAYNNEKISYYNEFDDYDNYTNLERFYDDLEEYVLTAHSDYIIEEVD